MSTTSNASSASVSVRWYPRSKHSRRNPPRSMRSSSVRHEWLPFLHHKHHARFSLPPFSIHCLRAPLLPSPPLPSPSSSIPSLPPLSSPSPFHTAANDIFLERLARKGLRSPCKVRAEHAHGSPEPLQHRLPLPATRRRGTRTNHTNGVASVTSGSNCKATAGGM